MRVGDDVCGEIGPGVLCLVGICSTDTAEEVKWASQKILNTRLWDSAEGKPWNVSVKDQGGGVLLVSQFTLHGVLKGNRAAASYWPGSHHGERPQAERSC